MTILSTMTKSKILWHILAIILALALASCTSSGIVTGTMPKSVPLSSCVMAPVGVVPTITGIANALNGTPGTGILESEKLIVFYWQVDDISTAFAVMDKSGVPMRDLVTAIGGGQRITVSNFSSLVDWLKANGYNVVSVPALPAAVVNIVQNIAAGAESLPTILLLPIVPGVWPSYYAPPVSD